MNPRARELARAILAGCAKTDEIHELAREVLVAPDLPPYPDDLRAELDRLETVASGNEQSGPTGSLKPISGSWRMGIREAVSALRPYLSGMQAEIERLSRLVEQGGICRGCGNAAHACECAATVANPLKIPCAEPGCYEWSVAVDATGRDVCREHSAPSCALCSGDSARETCSAVADLPWPYQCTRMPGHDGKHAACGMDADAHPIVEWS